MLFFVFGASIGGFVTLVAVLRIAWNFLNLNAAYKKTYLEFLENKIVVHYGSLFTNNSIEIVIDKITEMDDVIDTIIYSRPSKEELKKIVPSSEKILVAKSSIKNEVIPSGIIFGIIAAFIIFIFIAFLLIPAGGVEAEIQAIFYGIIFIIMILYVLFIAWIILKIRAREYSIQPYRVVAKSGILFKSQKSIIFTKIDHIAKGQGLLNKLFNNGSIVIHTTGSSLPEIVILNIPNQKEFYEKLEQFYK